MNKVYIAGTGIISAIGNNVDETLLSFEKHQSGISDISLLQTRHQNELPAGEIKLSNEMLAAKCDMPDWYPRTVLLSCIAANEALSNLNLENKNLRKGFISANTVGGMDKTENFFKEFQYDNSKGKLMDVMYHDCGKATDLVAEKINCTDFITTISTACSSSANAIMLGARMIQNNMLDVVVAGGADALTRFTLNGFNTLMILDKEQCKPLDQNRKGLNLGEGAAYVILVSERLAKEINADIICEITGWSNTNDANHQTALSENGEGPFLAMQGALRMSNLKPEQINYINMHGTGTSNNDAAEGKAIERIFHPHYPLLSSTKSFTGHTLGASGAVEAVLSILSIQKKIVYPNFNFITPINDLHFSPVTKLMHHVEVNHVLSNSFGFGGNCSSLIFSKN